MAATTALMQSATAPPPPPASPAPVPASSDSAAALECDDSDSGTASSDPNDDHHRQTSSQLKRSRSPDNDDEDDDDASSDREQEIDDKQPGLPRVIIDSSTEEEATVDDGTSAITKPESNGNGTQSSDEKPSSSSLLSNISNGHSSVKHRSTGKLERITERLAKRQNGNNQTQNDNADATKSNGSNNILFPSTMSDMMSGGENSTASDSIKDDSKIIAQQNDETNDDADDDDDDDVDEEEDEEIKNGFRALGLMGNVAFMGDESFKCPVCGLKLDSQHTFTLHIRSHNPNDHSNSCSLCGKTLSSASSLDRHMLIHSGERPFKCSLCGMAFTTNGNMHRHMRTHGHGSIGYTPRGQKRRAKLLTQALEKAVAAAAAGEQVDIEAINKLKKSILESKATPIPSGSSKRGQKTPSAPTFSEQLLSSMAPNVSIEAAAAAAVAAASNKSKCSSPDDTSPLTSLFNHSKDNTHHNFEAKKNTGHRSSSSSSSTSHRAPSLETPAESPSSSSLLKSGSVRWPPAAATGIPSTDLLSKRLMQQPATQLPEKGRPGRKKKPRLSVPMGGGFGVPPPSGLAASLPTTNATHPSTLGSMLATGVPAYPPPPPPPSATNKPAFGTRCPICGQPTRNTTELHVHMMSYHMQERLFCNDCGMILDNYDTYTQHRCTASAATVMSALSQNPSLRSDLLFCSSNTSRMNFSSARNYAANLDMLRGLQASRHPLLNGPAPIITNNNVDNPFSAQSLMDLTRKSERPYPSSSSSSSSNKSAICTRCNRKFPNAKQLRQHQETFCHQCNLECDSISEYQLHQFSHSLERFGGGQTPGSHNLNDKMQLLKNAAAFSLLPPQQPQPPPPVGTSLLRPPPVNKKILETTPNPSSPLSHSSMASLTSMANMKPDLADIESILSIVHGTTSVARDHHQGKTASNQLRSPISPNRASDAGEMMANRLASMNGGEAGTRQPESPASADSAAGAVASSNMPPGGVSQQQHSTRTDLDNSNNSGEQQALCLSKPGQVRSEQTTTVDNGKNSQPEKSDKNLVTESPVSVVRSRYRCESCRLSFKSMNALRRHNRGHTAGGGHSHACHLCPYKSLDKSTLIRHLRTHNGERPFQCAICKYAFTTKANCERHVRKRHKNLKSKSEIRSAMQYNRDMAATAAATRLVSEKIFIERDQLPTSQDTICKKCLMDFVTNRELRAHLRVPNNPCSQQLKPFVCTICKVGFNTRNNCVRHIIKQHPTTIEVSDDDQAKVVADACESLMIETGSSSPGSNGPISSSFSGLSSSSSASELLSECESYGTFDDEQQQQQSSTIKIRKSNNGDHSKNHRPSSPLNLSKRSTADDDDCDDDDDDDDYGEFEDDEEMMDVTTNNNGSGVPLEPPAILDLSCKSK